MSTTAEKLLYLQNGVFKRKEMSNGIQYYSNNSFGTFALPSANGNYVLTNNNNVFTWTDAGDVSTGGGDEPTFTSLDNSYFKGSDGQAISIDGNGTIPYFKSNTTFAGLSLPYSGTYVLTTKGGAASASFDALNAPLIFTTLGYENTSSKYAITNWNSSTSNHKNLLLPDKSGSFFLQTDSSLNYSFNTITAKNLFHDTLGIGSDSYKIVAYSDENAYGLSLPTTAGYATFKIGTGNTSPVLTNLSPQIVYKDILGCENTEKCIVYNNGGIVSKLTIPSNSGKYMVEVNSSGTPSLSLPDTKLSKTFECNCGSGISIVTQSLTSNSTNLSEAITLTSGKSYLVTIDTVISCSDYEQVIVGFTNTPNLNIIVESASIINIPLNNPLPTTLASGSSVITPTRTNTMVIEVTRTGDTTITHYFTKLKISVVEL